jgi:hypothetical protein
MNAALGSVYAGGIGAPEFDVTQNGGGPCALLAIQSAGNAGGMTLSKFVACIRRVKPGAQLVSGAAVVSAATYDAIRMTKQTTLRNHTEQNVRFKFSIMLPMRDQFYGRGRMSMLMRRSRLREEKSAMSELL